MGPIAQQATLRIAISEDVAEPELATLLALQRAEEPDVKIGLFEATFRYQAEGLVSGLYDAGFARSCGGSNGLLARPVWRHTLAAAVPARSPLLAYKQVPLEEILKYPMVIWHPEAYEGTYQQVKRVLDTASGEPIVGAQVESFDLMMALVAAGYGVGVGVATRISACRHLGVVMRPLACGTPSLTTYLLRSPAKPSDSLDRFIERAARKPSLVDCNT
jgi:DNA-binding transcriptional LysR family regulator